MIVFSLPSHFYDVMYTNNLTIESLYAYLDIRFTCYGICKITCFEALRNDFSLLITCAHFDTELLHF